MELLKVSTIEQAREKLCSYIPVMRRDPLPMPIVVASGRICAQDIFCTENIPPFRRSTMDGYAVCSVDTAAAGEGLPVFLRLKGTVEMGQVANFQINSGECAYVPTGGMLPEGADAVVMVEYCEGFGPDGIAVYTAVARSEHVVQPGEDMKAGDLIIRAGTVLSPQHIGALAAAGIVVVPVFLPLRLAIISTGDELIPPGMIPEPGQVRDSNTYALMSLAEKNHYKVTTAQLLRDDADELRSCIIDLRSENDIVVVSGGSSQGAKDITREVMDSISSPGVFLHGLAIKPGKPTILGYHAASQTILVGLPGHPVSAMMVFEMLFSWFSRQIYGTPAPFAIPAKLTQPVPGSEGKVTCCPVQLEQAEGRYKATPVHGKSGLVTTLTRADGFFIIERNREGVNAGETVLVHLM